MIKLSELSGRILRHTLNEATYSKLKVDGLYNLSPFYKKGELDYIYTDILNKTKFYKILLKEWWYYLKKGGRIIIEFTPNEILDFSSLIKVLNLFFKNEYAISYFDIGEDKIQVEITKIFERNYEDDNINSWTFGIITNGERIEWIEKVIHSIEKQKIPNYEIIVSGKLINKSIIEKYNLKYIEFTEKDDIGWITKKKNLVVENAKYENLMIMHDKIILDDKWFEGMKKYGNNFESLSCVTHTVDNLRYCDWKIALGKNLKFIDNKIYKKISYNVLKGIKNDSLYFDEFLLDYTDWDENIYIVGHFNIGKKSVFQNTLWDENLFWYCAEDLAFSRDLSHNGIVHKINIYSKVVSLNNRQIELIERSFDNEKLGIVKGQISKRIIFTIFKYMRIFKLDILIRPYMNILKNTKIYKILMK